MSLKRRTSPEKISTQMKRKVANSSQIKRKSKFDGNIETMISTGSTLLDLAISGGRVRGGGIPGGILVEIFGPSGSGKTVLLAEIAGAVKRAGGEVMFKDPEARLNKAFAGIFDLDVDTIEYSVPSTVPEVFKPIRSWEPDGDFINGIFADSLAALSTDMELEDKDQYGMRRAKEFSEQLRKTCRVLTDKNFLMVASNQIRDNIGGGQFSEKFKTPGGFGIPFYSSLRLRMMGTQKIKKVVKVQGKEVRRVIGVKTDVEVYKSSIWSPFRIAPLTIIFDYGVDDLRQNLQYIKDFTSNKVYTVAGRILGKSMIDAIGIVEDEGLEKRLKREVIKLWTTIEEQFEEQRKTKKR